MNGVKSRFWSPLCTTKILSGAMDLISPCNSWVCVMSWTHTCESWGAIFIHSCHISDEKWSGAGDKNGSGKTCFVSIYYISSFSHHVMGQMHFFVKFVLNTDQKHVLEFCGWQGFKLLVQQIAVKVCLATLGDWQLTCQDLPPYSLASSLEIVTRIRKMLWWIAAVTQYCLHFISME